MMALRRLIFQTRISSQLVLRNVSSSRKSMPGKKSELHNEIQKLEKKIKAWEADHMYPRRPETHPIRILIQEKIGNYNMIPGMGSAAMFNEVLHPKKVYTQVHKDWANGTLSQAEKERLTEKANANKEKHKAAIKRWYDLYQYSRALDEYEGMKDQLRSMKSELRKIDKIQ